jgi:hypothetical protein
MPHTVLDNILVMAWIALFLFAALVLLNLPAADLIMAGYRKGMYAYIYIYVCIYIDIRMDMYTHILYSFLFAALVSLNCPRPI